MTAQTASARPTCQMDWEGLDLHHKRWTCRVCGKQLVRNSADGHPITGEISFTVEGGPTSAPTTGGNVAPAVPAPTANPTPADGDGSTTMMYVLSGVAAVIIVVGGIVVFLSGRRRR